MFLKNTSRDQLLQKAYRPCSIYQYSNMDPRLSGQTSIFGVVYFESPYPSLLWELRDKRSLKNLQFWPESLRAMLKYWDIERGLLHLQSPKRKCLTACDSLVSFAAVVILKCKVKCGLYVSHVICTWLSFQLSWIMLYCASFESSDKILDFFPCWHE